MSDARVCSAALALAFAAACGSFRASSEAHPSQADSKQWSLPREGEHAPSDWASVGRNDYFVLEPGYTLVLADESGATEVKITVLDQTKRVDGVETRVIEERETEKGKLVEVSRNYYAFSKRDRGVYYFGEDTDLYKKNKVTSHEGSWRSGVGGAKFGLMMPGTPVLGLRFYQEHAPNVAMDRAEIVGLDETAETKAGTFVHCLKTAESTPLEKGVEHKLYAPGVGLVVDADVRLVRYGFEDASRAKK
jgi:hypothetical protein